MRKFEVKNIDPRLAFVAFALALCAMGPAQTGANLPPGQLGGGQAGQAGQAGGQNGATTETLTPEEKKILDAHRLKQRQEELLKMSTALKEGIEVRMGDIGGFRGARSNVILGYGLVVGLAGTGDTKQTPITAKLLSNALSRWGSIVDAKDLQGKNVALVTVTAELPPFAAPGRKIDITASSIGDAKSLEGGFLLPTPLGPATAPDQVYVMAAGSLSLGGFQASSGGASSRKNHQTVGRIPDGGDVQQTVATQFVFTGGKVYFDLDEPDFTTAQRVATQLQAQFPQASPRAVDAVTISLTIPEGTSPVEFLSGVEGTLVKANLPASIVINERTGTIVAGGHVKLGPAMIAHGSLQVKIEPDVVISQPAPRSNGETVVVELPRVSAEESPTQIAMTAGGATIEDLSKILQTLKVSAKDIIAILQALADQGALKARIRIQ